MRIHVKQIDENSLSGKIVSIVEPLLTGINSSLSGTVSDISDLSDDVTTISGSLTTLEDNISDQSGRLTNFESDFYNFETDLNTISGNVNIVSGDFLSLSGNVQSQIDNQLYTINLFTGDVAALESSLDSTISDLGVLSGNLNTVSGQLSSKLSVSNNLSDLQNANSGLENLNIRHQYLWLSPSDFVSGVSGNFVPTGGSTGTIMSKFAVPTLIFTGNNKREVYTSFSFPSNWDRGPVYPKIYCTAHTGSNVLTGNVLWGISAEYYDQGSALLGSGAPVFNIISYISGLSSTSGVLSIGPSGICSGMSITGVNSGDSMFDKLIIMKLHRDSLSAEDTFDTGVNISFIKMGIEYSVKSDSTRWAEDLI